MLLNIDQSKRSILIASLLAVTVHASLLLIKLRHDAIVKLPVNQEITIHLQPLSEIVKTPVEIETVNVEPETNNTPEKIIENQVDTIIQETVIVDQRSSEESISAKININSAEFKQWIHKETENHINKNPNSIEDFADTFTLPTIEKKVVREKSISSIESNLYETTRNGKVTCHLQAMLPFQNDFAPNAINTSRDCTPKKKFELDIRQAKTYE